jgi:limonene-1,2-epoxide hydrolase
VVDVDGDGLVTRWRDYFDLKEIDAQLPAADARPPTDR